MHTVVVALSDGQEMAQLHRFLHFRLYEGTGNKTFICPDISENKKVIHELLLIRILGFLLINRDNVSKIKHLTSLRNRSIVFF
jgi:hypothetical protein